MHKSNIQYEAIGLERTDVMILRASDLPSHAKMQLSRAIRDRIGHSTYEQLVSAIGEDAVLDMALQAMSGHSPSPPSSVRHSRLDTESPWQAALGVILGLVAPCPWLWICILVSGGWASCAFIFGGFTLLFFAVALFKALGALDATSAFLGWAVRLGVGAAVLCFVGYLLWIAVPWMISGVVQWWSWLCGHF